MQPSLNSILRSPLALWMGILAGLAAPCQTRADYTLTDGNSSVSIDFGSAQGMNQWQVQGQNQLAQQWFWYQIDNQPGGALNTLGAPILSNPNGTRGISVTYGNSSLSVQVDYLLKGGATVAPGQKTTSDVTETVTLYNNSSTPLNLRFFQYADFNLGGPTGNTVQFGRNLDGLWNEALQKLPSGAALTDAVLTPGADHVEAAYFGQTLAKLNTLGPTTTLNDNAALLTPGNVTWTLEWDLSIAPGGSAQISGDELLTLVVPEPSTLALLALALGAGALYRPRRSA